VKENEMKAKNIVCLFVVCSVCQLSAEQERPDLKIEEEFKKGIELFLFPPADKFDEVEDEGHIQHGWVYGDCPVMTFDSFADEPVKRVLLNIATNGTQDVFYRQTAIHSYLQRFSAQDARDLFVHLLANEGQFSDDLKGLVIGSVRRLFYETDKNTEAEVQKREAVFSSLYVMAARETNARMFRALDEFLQRRNDDYAASHQRVALLIKHANPANTPPDAAFKKWQEITQKSNRPYTSISTNLTELMTRDFSAPVKKNLPANNEAMRERH
jgi:hypothetical protein